MLGGRHFTHAFLLPVCASYDFEKHQMMICLEGGGWDGGVDGKRKKKSVWVLVCFNKCNRVFAGVLELHYRLALVFDHTREPALLRRE